jgi:hypothetical protein
MVVIITNVTFDFLVAMVIKVTIVPLLPCSLELPVFNFCCGYVNAPEMFCSAHMSYIVGRKKWRKIMAVIHRSVLC